MLEKSDDIVKQLNRLANDRNIAPRSRNQLLDAAQHIRDLHSAVQRIMDLHTRLQEIKRNHNAESGRADTESALE